MRTYGALLDSMLSPENGIASTRHLARRMIISGMVPTVSKKWSSHKIAKAHNHLVEQIIQVGYTSDQDKDLIKALSDEGLYKSSGKLYETGNGKRVPHLNGTSKFNSQLGESEQIRGYTNLRFLGVIGTKKWKRIKRESIQSQKG